jgi:hypothetical protein
VPDEGVGVRVPPPTLTRTTNPRRQGSVVFRCLTTSSSIDAFLIDDVPGILKDLFDLGVSTETARGAARVARNYTREYTLVGYIISVRTRLFSPSSPGESFLVPPAVA